MNSTIIVGFLWIIGGVLMLIKKSVSFGAIHIKLNGLSLYIITISIILLGMYMIFNELKKIYKK